MKKINRRSLIFKSICLLVLSSLFVGSSFATPMLFDWEDGSPNPFSDWSVGQRFTDVDAPAAIGVLEGDDSAGVGTISGSGNAMQIDADNLGGNSGGLFNEDVFYTTAFGGTDVNMNSYGDNNTDIAGIAMRFYSDAAPGVGDVPQVGFYFLSGTDRWFYDLNLVQGWNTYYASFSSSSGWIGYTDGDSENLFANDTAFNSAIMDVDAIGFYISYAATDGQVFGVDSYGLTVPEPETYLILGMALLSVAMVFRKQITDSLAEARAMLQV